jgi:putative FmdB family regulatory protein
MPTYEYLCRNCGHELEEFQSMKELPLTHCPNCNTESLVRIMGGGSGLIFKGTGFYITDYKKTSSAAGPSKSGSDSKTSDNKDSDKQESGKKDSGKDDSDKRETGKKDSGKKDAGKKDSGKKDSSPEKT